MVLELVKKAKKYIKELEELKDNLTYDYYENYSKIFEIANNFDSDFDDIYLVDMLYESDIITEDEAEDRLKYEIDEYGLDRARCFINDTTADTVYKISAYGNLQNVYISDFEDIIDEMINEIKKEIKEVKNNG